MIRMNPDLARGYSSKSQQARVVSEDWVGRALLCPRCGASFIRAPTGARVHDFTCSGCGDEFELKAKDGIYKRVLPAGAYDAMIERLMSGARPHLILCAYNYADWSVLRVDVVPSFALTPRVVEKRKPLSSTARRAGWTGCNIRLDLIPSSVVVPLVVDGAAVGTDSVQIQWHRIEWIRQASEMTDRTWSLEIIRCMEELESPFTLKDLYRHEPELSALFPDNKNVRAKIRQQVQFLCDLGKLARVGRATYAVV